MKKVNLRDKLALIEDPWHPHVVAQVNDVQVKLAKVRGEFVWHTHDEEDELFLVLSGDLVIKVRDGEVHLEEGDLFVVPKGVEHCPVAAEETAVLVMERANTSHTGVVESPMTVRDQEWI